MATKKFKQEFRARTVGFIATALGLVVGLAWNDAVASLIAVVFPIDKNSIIAKFLYAGILTVVVVTVIVLLMRFMEEKEEK
ncbi:MAG TPA: DUF5654 family protein [Candidatus Paceibacterota bacterium]